MNSGLNITSLVESFSKLKVMIVGDVMIDEYIFGKVERISPEAPVPVVHIRKREMRPGGAANVAINIKALGATPILCSVTGKDTKGNEFANLLQQEGILSEWLQQSDAQITTVKTRVIGNNHQLLRIDDERISPLKDQAEEQFIIHCSTVLESMLPDVLIFEDYDKGVITPGVISQLTAVANKLNIPITVDPKHTNFHAYTNVTLFKPNLSELESGAGMRIDRHDTDSIQRACKAIMHQQKIEMMMVTLSEAGVFILNEKEHHHIPAHIRNISDVSGAGDTVISVASLCVAARLQPQHIASLSNLAGGLVCEEVGVVPINKNRFIQEALITAKGQQ